MVGVDKAAGALAQVAGTSGGTAGIGVTNHSISDSMVGAQGATPFSSLVQAITNQTEVLGKNAKDAVTGLLNGQGVEIHDVMIAQQKASVSFELAMQVRNKAVSAYQQMMGMQF